MYAHGAPDQAVFVQIANLVVVLKAFHSYKTSLRA